MRECENIPFWLFILFALSQVRIHHAPRQVFHALSTRQTLLGFSEEFPHLGTQRVILLHLLQSLVRSSYVVLQIWKERSFQQIEWFRGIAVNLREVEVQFLQTPIAWTILLDDDVLLGRHGRLLQLRRRHGRWMVDVNTTSLKGPSWETVVVLCRRGIHICRGTCDC